MTDHLDPVLLAKWLAEQLTSEESRTIDEWLATDPARWAQLDELRQVWDRAGEIAEKRAAAAGDVVVEMARWSAIQRAIHSQEVPVGRWQPTRTIEFPLSHRPGRVRRWLVAAAVIALVVGGGAVWQAARYEKPTAEEFVAAVGMPRTITLSDGSMVTLAAGSRLTFVERRRSRSSRHATLDGQAFFAVTHDAQRPFIVTAGAITTRVLGTEFNVRAYPGDESPSVAVRSGKVRVTVSRAGTIAEAVITPGNEARVDGLGRIQVSTVDLDRTLAWTTGRLEFVGAELTSVLRDVNRWYGLQLRLVDTSLAHHRVTVTFDRATADDISATLTRLLGSSTLTSSPLPGSRR